MKFGSFLLVLFACIAASVATASYVGGHRGQTASSAVHETAYDRVMRTGTLRCGYVLYPRIFERDPNTGKTSGIYYDFLEEMGRQLSLKIDWAEEVGLSTAFDGLRAGRYDAVCFPLTQTPPRARVTEFTTPILFFPFFMYARADDNRFDNDYDKVNDPSVRVASLEGEMAEMLRNERFPRAQLLSLPNLTDPSQVYLSVTMGKADVAMAEPSSIEAFMLHNPGKLKRVPGLPLRMQNTGLDVAVGEDRLARLLDTSIRFLYVTGYAEHVLRSYATAPDQFYLPAPMWGGSAQPLPQAKP